MDTQRWWHEEASYAHPTIAIIERPEEGYDEFADRREREKDRIRVPFGFGRPLAEPAER